MTRTTEVADSASPRDDAIRLLARREYARAELESRLSTKGHAPQAIAECLDALAEEGLQSDRRFAEHFVRSRLMRGQGPVKIHADVSQRGVPREWADEALADADVDWYQLACEALAKRFSEPGERPRDRARRERFLAGRGFGFAHVRYALSHAWDDER